MGTNFHRGGSWWSVGWGNVSPPWHKAPELIFRCRARYGAVFEVDEMSALGDRLRELAAARATPNPGTQAKTANAAAPSPPPPKVGTHEWFRDRGAYAVPHSPELQRIVDLPRRRPFADYGPGELDELVEFQTQKYRRPGGTMRLKPVQAFALKEIEAYGGLLGPIGVGEGKTLISLLAPVALGAKRPLLLVKADLRAKLWDVDYPLLAQHWRIPHLADHPIAYADQTVTLHVASYEELSNDAGVELFGRLKPDCVPADEAHTLAPLVRSTRSTRWHIAAKKYRPKFVALTGTLLSRSVRQGSKLAFYSLGDGSPFPTDYPTLESFALALDFEDDECCEPGALRLLAADAAEGTKAAFARRVVETPGVVATKATSVSHIGLVFRERKVTIPVTVQRALDELRHSWVSPSGEEITDDLSFSRAARQLAAGFYYRWRWPESVSESTRRGWLAARREWFREVRDYLSTPRRNGVDSEARYERAVDAGDIQSATYPEWCAFRDGCASPVTEAVWIDDFCATDAAQFGNEQPCIIWYTHDALGRKIAELGGFQLYEGGELNSARILKENGKRSIVVSANAHYEGKDLTAFSRQLVTTPRPAGRWWEQLLGRTQREGQKAEEVEVYNYTHTPELRSALTRAVRNARWMSEMNNGADQRLLKASFTFSLES